MSRTFHPNHEWIGFRFLDADSKTWQIVEAWSYGHATQMGFVAVCLKDDSIETTRDLSLPLSYTNALDKVDMSYAEVQSILVTGTANHLSY